MITHTLVRSSAWLGLVLAALLVTWPGRAHAEDPWKVGVSAQAQAQALQLFKAGNESFETKDYSRAVVTYQEALRAWNHPAIHFNLAVALINLDRTLEAWDSVQQALRYDGGGIDPDKVDDAVTYRRLLAAQVVTVEVESQQDGVEVTFDGKVIITGKGKASFVSLPGAHALVATKAGHLTVTRNLTLTGGSPFAEVLPALRVGNREVKLVRRWRTSLPWLVTAGGGVVGLLGGAAMVVARADARTYESNIDSKCPGGCTADMIASDKKLWDRANLENTIGISMVAVGGAVVVGGLTMLVLNQPHEVEVQPTLALGGGGSEFGLSWSGRF